jgi:hypothetical protein
LGLFELCASHMGPTARSTAHSGFRCSPLSHVSEPFSKVSGPKKRHVLARLVLLFLQGCFSALHPGQSVSHGVNLTTLRLPRSQTTCVPLAQLWVQTRDHNIDGRNKTAYPRAVATDWESFGDRCATRTLDLCLPSSERMITSRTGRRPKHVEPS